MLALGITEWHNCYAQSFISVPPVTPVDSDPASPVFVQQGQQLIDFPTEQFLPPEPVPVADSPPAVLLTDRSEEAWGTMLRRLEQAEERLWVLEQQRDSWLTNPGLQAEAPLMAEDVEELDDGFLKALRDALEKAPKNGPTFIVTGQIQADLVTFNQSPRNKESLGDLENGTGFRRARLGAFGELFETTEYRVEFDFAGNGRPRFLDNWISVKEIPLIKNVIVGHFFEPFSLERYTPNRFITFLERSSVDVFAPARNMGMMTYGHAYNENLIWAFGVFSSDSDVYGDSVSDASDFAGTGHVTWLPYYCEDTDGRHLLHLGASFSYRKLGDKQVRFRKRPENELQAFRARDFPVFADTMDINADTLQLLGVEAAWVHGPLSVQSEAVVAHVNRLDGDNPTFYGWYAYASYFLTGENRSYARTSILGRFREGIFQRITPKTNAFKGDVSVGNPRGIGAWEVAARYSYINLDSQDIHGNELGTVTVGVNWYLNPNTRIQWNYLRPMLRDADVGKSHADIFGMRFGFEF